MTHAKRTHGLTGFLAVALLANGLSLHAAPPTPPKGATVASVNKASLARQRNFKTEWRDLLGSIGSRQQLKSLGTALVGLDEKLAQGANAIGQGADVKSRMRSLLSRHVVDERELREHMKIAYELYRDALAAESAELFSKAGLNPEVAVYVLIEESGGYEPPKHALDRLVKRAKLLAESDWMRTGAILLGSSVATDALYGDTNDMGWFGVFTRFATEAALDVAMEFATSPVERFADELGEEWSRVESALLVDKGGLFPAIDRLTDWHIALRNDYQATVKEGE